MPVYDASTADCQVFSYKEGLLSRVAHDIRFRVTRFELELAPDAVRATFDPASLEVVCAMKKGRDNPRGLTDKDKREVLKNIAASVLHPDRFPEIRFTSSAVTASERTWTVVGTLALHGREQQVRVTAQVQGGQLVARVRLHQPDYGIVPFTAMMGALKIRPHVDVELRVPLP